MPIVLESLQLGSNPNGELKAFSQWQRCRDVTRSDQATEIKRVERNKANLKDCEKGDGETVEVGERCLVREIERPAKELHAQQSKNEDEKEEEEQQGNDGAHWA